MLLPLLTECAVMALVSNVLRPRLLTTIVKRWKIVQAARMTSRIVRVTAAQVHTEVREAGAKKKVTEQSVVTSVNVNVVVGGWGFVCVLTKMATDHTLAGY